MFYNKNRPIKVCLLSYRCDPYCGGQGVYIKNLAIAIEKLGHKVEIITGPPKSFLDTNLSIRRLSSLDLYDSENLFRFPSLSELFDPINFLEWFGVSTMGFPEVFTFGIRINHFLKDKFENYDIVHDNQNLSYGIWKISKKIPTVVTIHHPITKDREIALNESKSVWEKIKYLRWYSFIGMQKRVSKKISKIITVSNSSKEDISKEFKVFQNKFRVIPNGINTNFFKPIKSLKREKNLIITLNSSISPIKGLKYLLKAINYISTIRTIKLMIIGNPINDSSLYSFVKNSYLEKIVSYTGNISNKDLVSYYLKASVAVVPSLYEGFGFPICEAMSCGLPIVCTSAGALPEVIGNSGIVVPPKNYFAISNAIIEILDNKDLSNFMGKSGFLRVRELFSWEKTAKKTLQVYSEVISDNN